MGIGPTVFSLGRKRVTDTPHPPSLRYGWQAHVSEIILARFRDGLHPGLTVYYLWLSLPNDMDPRKPLRRWSKDCHL